jgi:hypothetical protein
MRRFLGRPVTTTVAFRLSGQVNPWVWVGGWPMQPYREFIEYQCLMEDWPGYRGARSSAG